MFDHVLLMILMKSSLCRNLTSSERRSLRVEDSSAGTCLVAVARLQHFGDDGPKVSMETSENEFVTRVAVDGRFSYVDPRYVCVWACVGVGVCMYGPSMSLCHFFNPQSRYK